MQFAIRHAAIAMVVGSAFGCGASNGVAEDMQDDSAAGTQAAGGSDIASGGTQGQGGTHVSATGSIAPDGAFCSESDIADPRAYGEISATSGDFQDECDAQGDLIEYSCEMTFLMQQDPLCFPGGPTPTPSQQNFAGDEGAVGIALIPCETLQVPTGEVTSQVVPCAGLCEDGVCPSRCPEVGDTATYVTIDGTGAARFEIARTETQYDCDLIFDRDGDGYDCPSVPVPGLQINIVALGIQSDYCLDGAIGNIGTDDPNVPTPQECSYSCQVVAE